jgi:hypothetical protein
MTLGFGALGELPLGYGSNLPPAPTVTAPTVFLALRQFLLAVLPASVDVIQAQDNRVPEPANPVFVLMTPLRRMRLATNQDEYIDCRFTGSISGTTLTVTDVSFGTIINGATVSGVGILSGTTITNGGSGGGGIGAYTVSTAQNVSSRTLATGYASLMQETEVVVQLDIHAPPISNPSAQDLVAIVTTSLRDSYATEWFAANYPGVSPLYADDGRQIPFVNENDQTETRWVVEVNLQIDPTINLPLQFADEINVVPIPVDLYPA